jgi:hypothetical protein
MQQNFTRGVLWLRPKPTGATVKIHALLTAIAIIPMPLISAAQQPAQTQLKIDSSNRTIAATADDTVAVEPDLAVLHIGFDTPLEDAKAAYADGARISNAIIAAVKQAGVAEGDIRSESQYLNRDWNKPHKFKLTQQWTVRVPPGRAAEILDVAVSAGATTSGEIEWTVRDEHALEAQVLERAASRAKANAEVIAKGMGVHIGSLLYVSNQVQSIGPRPMMRMSVLSAESNQAAPPPLAIEPHKVSRTANVYAVYSIE